MKRAGWFITCDGRYGAARIPQAESLRFLLADRAGIGRQSPLQLQIGGYSRLFVLYDSALSTACCRQRPVACAAGCSPDGLLSELGPAAVARIRSTLPLRTEYPPSFQPALLAQ